MTQLFFLILCLALHVLLFRLFRRDKSLSLAEQFAASYTLQIHFWTALGFLLAFPGFFKLPFILNAGVVGAFLIFYFSLFGRKNDQPKLDIKAQVKAFCSTLNPIGWASVAVIGFTAIYLLVLGIYMPVLSWDGLSYHLGVSIHIFQDADLRHYPGESYMGAFFARGAHLLMAMSIMLSGTIKYVNMIQWLVYPALLPSVYSTLRAYKLERNLALLITAFILTVPVASLQSTMAYTDLYTSGWAIVALCAIMSGIKSCSEPGGISYGRLFWMFAAAGIAVGAKSNLAPFVLILGLGAVALWGPKRLFLPKFKFLGMSVLAFALSASAGLPWIIRNWVGYGSPIYPIMLTYSRDGLAEYEYTFDKAARVSEPDKYYEMPLWKKTKLSWTTLNHGQTREFGLFGQHISKAPDHLLHNPDIGFNGDSLIGGNGWLWLYGSLPGMILLALLAGIYPGLWGENKKYRWYLLFLAIAPFIGYTRTISAFWPRFSIFLPLSGVIALGILLSGIRNKSRLLSYVLLVPMVGLAFLDWCGVVMQNPSWERMRRHQAHCEGNLETPVYYYYIKTLYPYNPDPSLEVEAIRYVMDHAKPGDTVSFWTPLNGIFTGLFANEDASVRQFLFPSVWPGPFRYSEDELMDFIYEEEIRLLMISDKVPKSFEDRLVRHGGEIVFENGRYKVYELDIHDGKSSD